MRDGKIYLLTFYPSLGCWNLKLDGTVSWKGENNEPKLRKKRKERRRRLGNKGKGKNK